ncbi:hypothetical protein N7530_011824 [Penicillium desertorum]|uniref:Fatty acid desaturase domain-containing protein n=1 Tax=Penicillium desertorum TaxID=1303715 RepID=A0A9W9WE54_9EURO|nr:hypothetical protein N7530_011824 [Penicillium desertorum]
MAVTQRQPVKQVEKQTDVPSLQSLKDAIPKECFESSLATSLLYLARDIAYCAALIYAALHIHLLPTLPMRIVAWAVYGFFQGCVGTGLWILAHECGHGAFSKHQGINDFIGWATHSFLMVPYFSWKITHARHHRYTGHMEKDTVFVPWTEDDLASKRNVSIEQLKHLAEETPIVSFIQLIGHQLLGWQMYLILNVTAGTKSGPEGCEKVKYESHYNPSSSIFTAAQWKLIVYSDIGLLIMGSIVWYTGTIIGAWNVFFLYVVPYLWLPSHTFNTLTLRLLTTPRKPGLTPRGALATIDRTTGFIGRHFFHEIIDYHVVHHLFSRIPFYHAEKATKAIQPMLGENYHEQKDEGFLYSLMMTFRKCIYVSESKGRASGQPGVLHFVLSDESK